MSDSCLLPTATRPHAPRPSAEAFGREPAVPSSPMPDAAVHRKPIQATRRQPWDCLAPPQLTIELPRSWIRKKLALFRTNFNGLPRQVYWFEIVERSTPGRRLRYRTAGKRL